MNFSKGIIYFLLPWESGNNIQGTFFQSIRLYLSGPPKHIWNPAGKELRIPSWLFSQEPVSACLWAQLRLSPQAMDWQGDLPPVLCCYSYPLTCRGEESDGAAGALLLLHCPLPFWVQRIEGRQWGLAGSPDMLHECTDRQWWVKEKRRGKASGRELYVCVSYILKSPVAHPL